MADEKQLTVAELLARNKKDRTDKDEKTSRRRRRSLDEGGVSVAELTGSLKKVKSTPPEAKHTSVSIDDDAPVIRAPKSKDEQSAGNKAAESKTSESKPAAGKAAAGKPSAEKPAAGTQEGSKQGVGQSGIGKPAQSKPSQPQSASPKPAAEKPSAGTPTASPAPKQNGKPSGPTASPKPAAGSASQPTAKPAPAQKTNAQEAKKPAQSEPEDKAGAQDAEKKSYQPSADDTAVIQRIGKSQSSQPSQDKRKDAADGAESSTKEKAGAAGAAGAGAAAATAAGAKGAKDAGTKAKADVPAQKPAAAAKKSDDTGELPQVRDEEITEEHEKLNPMSILIMVVVGIVLAIIIFKGFEVLWDNFPRIVVAILALCVTAIMAGVTHALRTARDGFSMFLAGITGLILTFGPLLLVML